MIPGIPTIWRYRRYRSRLEARWACMFDLLGWKYEYEPYDLNGWIPDFAIWGEEEILVNIKPNSKFQEWEDTGELRKIMNGLTGTNKYGKEILLLGSTIFESADNYLTPSIGWLGEFGKHLNGTKFEHDYAWGCAALNRNGKWGFFHDLMWYKDRITGMYDGDGHLRLPSYDDVLKLWNKAGDLTQWKKP